MEGWKDGRGESLKEQTDSYTGSDEDSCRYVNKKADG